MLTPDNSPSADSHSDSSGIIVITSAENQRSGMYSRASIFCHCSVDDRFSRGPRSRLGDGGEGDGGIRDDGGISGGGDDVRVVSLQAETFNGSKKTSRN